MPSIIIFATQKIKFMLSRLIIIAIFCLFVALPSHSQGVDWEDFATEYFADSEETGEDSENYSLYEELLEMHRSPLNINLATRADLLKMPFLNEAQADSILSLRNHYGTLLSMGDLHFVKNLYHKERSYMQLFFYCAPIPQPHKQTAANTAAAKRRPFYYNQEADSGLKNTVSMTLGVPLYKREGFKSHTTAELEKNPNKQYLGNNLSNTLRYQASLDNRIYWGLTAQKDEGEPFASGRNALYDSYGFYLAGRSRGVVQQWVVGDYRAHFGMGLTIGASAGDAMNIISSYRPRQIGFARHTSTDEARFMRGAAISLKVGSIGIHAFASWRQLDATLQGDSISTILTNGYHRTPLEMSKRHNIKALQGGLSLQWSAGPFAIGANATHTHYNTPYRRPTSLYRKYYFTGQDFGNYSLNYSWQHNALKLWGESATSMQGGLATIHRLQYTPSYKLNLALLHRYYSKRYLTPTAQSYKTGSRIQNEHGLMLGANWQTTDYWRLAAYADYARFPFATYYTNKSAYALTTLLQAEYSPNQNTALLLRYKCRIRPNYSDPHATIHTLKLQARYPLGPLSLTTTADLAANRPAKTCGWMLAQKATYILSNTTRFGLALAQFHTDTYADALRLYEPTLLYSTTFPTLYYHGQRLALTAVHTIGPLSLALKYSLTHYTNRQSIGTGLRSYNGSTLQDISVQLVARF